MSGLTQEEINTRFPTSPSVAQSRAMATDAVVWRDVVYRQIMNGLLSQGLPIICMDVCEPIAEVFTSDLVIAQGWPPLETPAIITGWRRDCHRKSGEVVVFPHKWLRFSDGHEFDPELDAISAAFRDEFVSSRHATREDAAMLR